MDFGEPRFARTAYELFTNRYWTRRNLDESHIGLTANNQVVYQLKKKCLFLKVVLNVT